MTASVRITRVTAATAPAASVGRGVSTSSAGTKVRLADVTAQAFSTNAAVRLADVTAVAGTALPAAVRISDITAYSPTSSFVWTGTAWVLVSPASTAISFGQGKSTVSGTRTGTQSGASIGTGRSTVTATVTRSGTMALSGGGSLTPSGGELGANDKAGEIDLSGGGTLKFIGNASQGPAGFGSVSVFPHPEASPPYIEIDLTGFLGTTAQLVRIDQAGNRTAVRLANPASLDGGSWSGDDFEAPYGVPCTYECVATITQTSDPVTLDVTTPWLIHPGVPTLSQPLILSAVPQRTFESNQGVHNVMGASKPIVVTDGARRAPTYDLALRTETASAALGLEALLADTQVLLLQIRYSDVTRAFYEWVAIGQVTTSSMTDYFGDDLVNWTLAATVTDSPDDANQGERTLAALAAEFSTLGEIAINYATLADIIADNLIGS